MKCLETRTDRDGFKRRRYESASGTRHTTIEIPIELWSQINGQGRGQNRAAAVKRVQERASLKAQARSLSLAGFVSNRAIARGLGVAESTVRRWTK